MITFVLRYVIPIRFERIGKQVACAVLVKPVQFRNSAHENASQHQTDNLLRVMLCINQRQGRPPRAPEHVPSIDSQMLAKRLQIGNRRLRVVVLQFSVGS